MCKKAEGGRRWPLLILALLYVPWTIIGLIGDTKQEYWPLVAGETLGLVLAIWAITSVMRLNDRLQRLAFGAAAEPERSGSKRNEEQEESKA